MREIRVSARTGTSRLATEIIDAVTAEEPEDVVIAAIGPFPVANAIKGVIEANRRLAPRGTFLAIIPGVEQRKIMDREKETPVPWTITRLRVVDLSSAR